MAGCKYQKDLCKSYFNCQEQFSPSKTTLRYSNVVHKLEARVNSASSSLTLHNKSPITSQLSN